MSTCIIFLYYVGYDVVILYLFVLNTSSGTMTPDQLITWFTIITFMGTWHYYHVIHPEILYSCIKLVPPLLYTC